MISYFCEIDINGKIVRSCSVPTDMLKLQIPAAFNTIVETSILINPETQYIDTSTQTAIDFPAKPSNYHSWNWASKQYEIQQTGLDKAKADKKLEIDNLRKNKEFAPISYDNKNLDANEEAIKNINGKLQELYARDATVNPPNQNTLIWRDADNNIHTWQAVPIYKSWLQGLAIEVASRTTSLYQVSWTKKTEIENLTTIDDILAYDITIGWPTGPYTII